MNKISVVDCMHSINGILSDINFSLDKFYSIRVNPNRGSDYPTINIQHSTRGKSNSMSDVVKQFKSLKSFGYILNYEGSYDEEYDWYEITFDVKYGDEEHGYRVNVVLS